MARGGARDGAGRKPNTPNKATKERQGRIEASGVKPFDVMIEDMLFSYISPLWLRLIWDAV